MVRQRRVVEHAAAVPGDWLPGLYEQLLTEADRDALELHDDDLLDVGELADAEAADRLSRHVARLIARLIAGRPDGERAQFGTDVVTRLLDRLDADVDPDRLIVDGGRARLLRAVHDRLPTGAPDRIERPLTPLLDTTLMTNAPGEPALAHELRAEVASAQAIDVLMAFIRFSGIRPMLDDLRRHCAAGRRLRIVTTTYTGTTEVRALDELLDLGAQVRVSYDEGSTRLHAKAWIFQRGVETTTAYLGSSNLTHTAQHAGLEWNVRLSSASNPDVIDKMRAAFEATWESTEVVDYDPDDFRRRRAAAGHGLPGITVLPPTDVELRPYQEALLERIAVVRRAGRHRNLLVAATGTGKTVMAAVDYSRMAGRPPLLFVAHREELLSQALATYRHVVRDASFGELWVGGTRPTSGTHVFASVQSLAHADLAHIRADRFAVVVVDEFHHAAAPTYTRLLEHLRPAELLGLTATPDRADGIDVLAWFEGRIAAELRLWDAVSAGHLAPFAYYGVADSNDYSGVPWTRGRGYDPTALTGVLTANHAWAHLVIAQVRRYVADPTAMRALGFCVSVGHARFMAERFTAAGIPSVAVSAATDSAERRAALDNLQAGRIAAIFAVDLFNEGVDLPAIDTLLLLRPTDSGTLFLQQLGRGLRRSPGKSVCTVIDFVANHRQEFRYDLRFRALLGGSRRQLEDQVTSGFPFLPAGCSLTLDRVAAATVLESIRRSLPSQWRAKVAEAAALRPATLGEFLTESGLDLDDVYGGSARGWTQLRRDAHLPTAPLGPPGEDPLLQAIRRLTHVDDPVRTDGWRAMLTGDQPPDVAELSLREQRLARMLLASLPLPGATGLPGGFARLWPQRAVRDELVQLLDVLAGSFDHLDLPLGPGFGDEVPLRVHARYTRNEVLTGLGAGTALAAPSWREGVRWLPDVPTDVFVMTLDKTSAGFSPTTRYHDYAISPWLIHWESQSMTSADSPTGRRYVHHQAEGSSVLLFARLNSAERAFWCLGPATYVRHEGSRPMAVTWRLRHPLSGDLFERFAAAVAG